MPAVLDEQELELRMRSFGGGTARATNSLIDRALSKRNDLSDYVCAEGDPRLERISASGIVKLARSLPFSSEAMARLFTADVDKAGAFLFSASLSGRSGPGLIFTERATWADSLAESHATALYHLRSQFWGQQSAVMASGRTMDEVLSAAADDGSPDSFCRHCTKLSARLRTIAERHLPAPGPSRLRWGYTGGRLPQGFWSRVHESTDTFLALTERIADERGFAPCLAAAKRSFARNSLQAVTDFCEGMTVAAQIQDVDLQEIQAAASCAHDFIISAAALRVSIAKNVWSQDYDASRAETEVEIFRDGGWVRAPSIGEVARILVGTTISDLDRLRLRAEWMSEKYPTPFVAMTNTTLSALVDRVQVMLSDATFFAAKSRSSRHVRAETTDPLAPVRAPPQRRRGQNRNDAASNAGPLPLNSATTETKIYVSSDDDASADVDEDSRAILFVEEGVEGAPPLEVRDAHEDMAPLGGATCFELDRSSGRWRMFADQDKGSIYITAVKRCLGYRGFGRSTFLIEAYGPEGELHCDDVVAVVSYDRSRLDMRVASTMDAMEGLPPSVGRLSRPMYRPYINRPLRLSPAVIALATDHVSSFPTTPFAPTSEESRIVSGQRRDRTFVYTEASGRVVRLPCEGWGAHASPELKSCVRAFWQMMIAAICPHDLRMRLTKCTTHVLFDDGEGNAAEQRYALRQRTILNVWDGRITMAEERDDAIVYVIDNDLPESRSRLAIVSGYLIGTPDIPMSTARLIETYWRQRGQTCPHVLTTALPEADDEDETSAQGSGTGLIASIDLDRAGAATWLRAEGDRAIARL